MFAALPVEVHVERCVELERLRPGDVPDSEGDGALLSPGRTTVARDEELDVLLRAGRADAARVAGGLLDVHDRIEPLQLRLVTDTHQLLVGCVAGRRNLVGVRPRAT